MAEVYPMRASGEYAGMLCEIKKCSLYARYTVTPVGLTGHVRHLCCGQHLPVICKGVMYESNHAVVVQEVPGNWFRNGNELAAFDGVIRSVHLDRRERRDNEPVVA